MREDPILLLAAGLSSRMGGADKQAEPVEGIPLLTRLAHAACDVSSRVFVALPSPDHPRAALLGDLPVTPLALPGSAEGMGGTLRDGVAALPDCARFMVLLTDLPLIGAAEMEAVFAAADAAPDHLIWRGATPDGRPGHPILFDATLRPGFARLGGDEGGESLVRPLHARTFLLPFADDRARLDLDTPEDWAAFRAR
ncbi:nucleotidyltransferase family protein [Pseudoroseicyclus tamaricis]|uniref:Nucleotidyltransferase family protein n=1 Tax=Pseudoroseicyclus tamaricis TaxID=2705421 RepID=A0A6B2JJW4_9RHOB|nr:nucleotidyltransferase family protein [Pseudoroseicyclus tamaricis]NDV01733.1 nucleotidyltransferase family protein [Pseudoroseicyclus tamaricis]